MDTRRNATQPLEKRPSGPAAPGMLRASILVEARDEEAVANVESWLERHWHELRVAEDTGCGCCVVACDIEAPAALVDSIPDGWRATSEWDDNRFSPPPFEPVPPLRRLWNRLTGRLP